MSENLNARIGELAIARALFDSGDPPVGIRPDVLSSWQRSEHQVDTRFVPKRSARSATDAWAVSPIGDAAALVDEVGSLAVNEGYIAAVTDADGLILRTQAAREMLVLAERANFLPGADWSESSVGTSAPGLCLEVDRPTQVFSLEHWRESTRDWVCYAAPIHDATGALIGCINLSSTWNRANPMAFSTVTTIARLIDSRLAEIARSTISRQVVIKVLGKPRVLIHGRRCSLSPRQLEILAVLALCPDGLDLDQLMSRVYGDRQVSTSTVKAEVSHLRTALGGGIESRPYRITGPTDVDVANVYESVRTGNLAAAVTAYTDQLMPSSEAPFLIDRRHHLDVTLRTALLADGRSPELLRYARVHPFDEQVIAVAHDRIAADESCKPELQALLQRTAR